MKKDAADHLREGGAEAFRARVDQDIGKSKGNGHAKALRFQVRPFESIKLSTEPSYRVKGILPRVGLVVVWGPPKCGKSFWTFDLVMHVALNWKYRGRKVQQGTIVYLALEGGEGFARRVEAWRQRRFANHDQPVPFYLLDVPIDLVADHKTLIEDIGAQIEKPDVVVIDTLNRALLGDENKSDDMAKFIRAADAIRTAFDCVVIIIHHCGVVRSRPRGHTSLTGADDAQIAVYRDKDGDITVTVEHMKDGEASAPMGSKLEVIKLGLDDDGDEMSSCIIVPAEVVDKKKAKKAELPGTAKLALDRLRNLIAKKGEVPPASEHIPPDTKVCSAMEWREHFYNAYTGESDKPDTKRKAFDRATLKLQEFKLVGVWSGKVWLIEIDRTSGHGRTSEQMSGAMSGERLEPGKTDPGISDMGLPGQDRTSPLKGMSGMSDVRGSGLPGSFNPSMPSLDSSGDDESEEGPITEDERRQLRERGFAECDISAFTSAQARDILKPSKRPFPFKTVPDRPPKGHPCVHCGKIEGEIILVTEPGTFHRHHPLHKECAAEFFSKRKEAATAVPLGKVVITQADKARLRERGYSTAQIREMKPEDVQAILQQPGRSVTKWGMTFHVIGPAAPGSACLYCRSSEPDESGAVMMISNHGRLHEDCAPAWINNSNRSK